MGLIDLSNCTSFVNVTPEAGSMVTYNIALERIFEHAPYGSSMEASLWRNKHSYRFWVEITSALGKLTGIAMDSDIDRAVKRLSNELCDRMPDWIKGAAGSLKRIETEFILQ
ncbi:MAG: hypothetical protein AABZ06_01705 [Bdellovibrionota bacterium]